MGDMADYYREQWDEDDSFYDEDEDDIFWTMKDGTQIKYTKMETSHLMNCKALLERKYALGGLENNTKYRAICSELEKRS